MPFTEEDKIFVNNLLDLKGYNGMHLVRKFPNKSWMVGHVVPAAADVATPA